MGPTALFDKSFLESLNPDEAVWFDHYFNANICPLFFVETLADLAKEVAGRTPEQIVGSIANKFPSMHGLPNVNHQSMCIGSLLGHEVKLDGRIVLPPGDRVADGSKRHVHYKQSTEDEAMGRWKQGHFFDVERDYARGWRDAITRINLEEIARQMRAIGIDQIKCKTAEDARAAAARVADRTDMPRELMQLLVLYFGISRQQQEEIQNRWVMQGMPPLSRFAPYAHYTLTVELFLNFAVANEIVSPGRATNRIDLMYLHYLPCCEVFVSSDRLHRTCAPAFFRGNQSFVWGPDLKAALSRALAHYATFPEEVKAKGLFSYADTYPEKDDPLLAPLWDKHRPGWRERNGKPLQLTPEQNRNLADYILSPAPQQPDAVSFQRKYPAKRGRIQILPKDK